jgi:hypothetical protein
MERIASVFDRAADADTSLASLLQTLEPHGDKSLALQFEDGRRVRSGFHVTEVKAGSFVTLDCGGNPDAWKEVVVQVEDIPAADDQPSMPVRKFQSIIGKVASALPVDLDARLTIEVSRPEEPMAVHDVAGVEITTDGAVIHLAPRPAICKPRHRAAAQASASCCGPATSVSACCGPT